VLLRYVLINKPKGNPATTLEGFPQEASRGPSAGGRDRSLENNVARLLLWKTPSFMPEVDRCRKASFTPILTSFFPNVPILSSQESPIRRSPGQPYYQHAPACPARIAPPPAPVLILPRGRPEERLLRTWDRKGCFLHSEEKF
jgi:hypothetical protein